MYSQPHSDTLEHSKKTPFQWNGLRNWSTKLCPFDPFSPEILSAVFLIVWESATPRWMGWSQLTALPVKSLPCSSDTSKSFPTTIWLSWGFNLYSQRGFHFQEQQRSCPVLSQQIQQHGFVTAPEKMQAPFWEIQSLKGYNMRKKKAEMSPWHKQGDSCLWQMMETTQKFW